MQHTLHVQMQNRNNKRKKESFFVALRLKNGTLRHWFITKGFHGVGYLGLG
jgi:hypothetical protein